MNTQTSALSQYFTGILRFALWLILIIGLLLAIGYIYQRRTTAADFEKFPPPGQRVDMGGYRLHIYCTGEGNTTVVVDTGNGDFSIGWLGIQRDASKFTRICTYDRAGYGWSDSSPNPRTAAQMAAELHQLLVNAKIDPPYILVGQSLGGLTVRMFASQYPDEVLGMVLVDAGHEDQLERLPPEYVRLNNRQESYFSVLGFMSRFGIMRLIGNSSNGADFAPPHVLKMPKDVQPLYLMMMAHPSYFDTTLAEQHALPETTSQVRATGSLGDLPLIVLTAENTLDPKALQSMGLPDDFDAAQIQQTWLELQAELAALSTNSVHLIVKDSTHAIELDKPDVVITAILEMVKMVE
ncbi:MAG TPA: alpha/beta hydrolase [Anaerolineales bacterium]|nr:alpha/beta hydrolase [Anaerolineales bacterium]